MKPPVHPIGTCCALACLLLTTPARATLITSIDFGQGALQSGEPAIQDDFEIPGATTWNNLATGNGPGIRTVVTAEGPTFTVGDTNPAHNYGRWDGGGSDPLRMDYFTLNSDQGRSTPGAEIPWSISGLTPNASYDLILFSNSAGQSGAFAIPGFDAGNGIGAPVTADTNGDGNFFSVPADGSGVISGTFGENHANWHTFAGIQIASVNVIPEPGTAGLLLLGLGSLALRRGRR